MFTIFRLRRLIAFLTLIAVSTGAHSAVTITAVETGGNVVITLEGGGSLDISGMLFGLATESDNNGLINPSNNAMLFGPAGDYTVYQGISGSAFGPGGFAVADSYTGSTGPFGFGGDELFVTDGYVSGDEIAGGSISFAGESFASLGIDSGTYVYTLLGSNDTITLNVVPIPAAVWLFGSALLGLGWLRRSATVSDAP